MSHRTRSSEATRAVALYQAQTVARPTLAPDCATTATRGLDVCRTPDRAPEPATRVYEAGLLERLRGQPEPAPGRRPTAGAKARQRSRRLAIAAMTCIAAAIALLLVASRPAPKAASAHEPRKLENDTAEAGRRVAGAVTAASALASPATPNSDAAPVPSERSAASPPIATDDPGAPTPRAAAELLARGRYRAALEAYEQLARSRPDHAVYAQLVAVISRRLAQHCASLASSEGPACSREPR